MFGFEVMNLCLSKLFSFIFFYTVRMERAIYNDDSAFAPGTNIQSCPAHSATHLNGLASRVLESSSFYHSDVFASLSVSIVPSFLSSTRKSTEGSGKRCALQHESKWKKSASVATEQLAKVSPPPRLFSPHPRVSIIVPSSFLLVSFSSSAPIPFR